MPEIFKCYLLIALAVGICIFIASFFLIAYSGLCMESGSKKALKLNKISSRTMLITVLVTLCGAVIVKFVEVLLTDKHCF